MTGAYADKWAELRKLQKQLLFIAAASFPVDVVLLLILPVSSTSPVFILVNLCWLVLFGITLFRLRNWRCPQCEKRFFAYSERYGLSFLTKSCGNCQLRKYS